MTTNNEVYQIISATLEVPIEVVRPEVSLRSLPNVESIKILSIILKVERRYEIELPDDVTFRVETIGEFEALVSDLRARRAALEGQFNES